MCCGQAVVRAITEDPEAFRVLDAIYHGQPVPTTYGQWIDLRPRLMEAIRLWTEHRQSQLADLTARVVARHDRAYVGSPHEHRDLVQAQRWGLADREGADMTIGTMQRLEAACAVVDDHPMWRH